MLDIIWWVQSIVDAKYDDEQPCYGNKDTIRRQRITAVGFAPGERIVYAISIWTSWQYWPDYVMMWTMMMRVTLTNSHSACFWWERTDYTHTRILLFNVGSGEEEKILIIMIQPTRAKCRETNTPASWGLLTVLSGQRDASGTANKVDPPSPWTFLILMTTTKFA